MAVKDTIQIGDLRLKAPNQPINDYADSKLKQLITDLKDSMHHANLIGIAAPQIGENYQAFVTQPRETKFRPKDQTDKFRVYINPKIINTSTKQVVIYEGCGSVLHGQLFGPVQRPQDITIEAFDENGDQFHFTADGILGRVIQHEYDHMSGIEFLEKISDYKKMMTVDHYQQQIKNDPQHIQACQITTKNYRRI